MMRKIEKIIERLGLPSSGPIHQMEKDFLYNPLNQRNQDIKWIGRNYQSKAFQGMGFKKISMIFQNGNETEPERLWMEKKKENPSRSI